MFEILRNRNKSEEKRIINILKESAGEAGNYENSEMSIKTLINKIKIKSIEEKKK